jgi:hypothetical protein
VAGADLTEDPGQRIVESGRVHHGLEVVGAHGGSADGRREIRQNGTVKQFPRLSKGIGHRAMMPDIPGADKPLGDHRITEQ